MRRTQGLETLLLLIIIIIIWLVKRQYVLKRLQWRNLRSGSRLASANDTAAHYAAIHCSRQQTTGRAVCSKQTYHRPNQPH